MSTISPSSPATAPEASPVRSLKVHQIALVLGIAGVLTIASEWAGTATFPVGFTKVTLFPFLWALLACVLCSIAMKRADASGREYIRTQTIASDFVQIGIMLFIAKLGFTVGINLQKVIAAGPVLLLQEAGNFLGTIVLALPVALLLGIKREAIGATFSVGREPGVALIAERYGMNSAEGRGVLAEYVTGSVIGAAFMAFFASMVAHTGIFSPEALGMAAGIGSGSMTAAAVGAISVQYPAEKDTIAALAAASNLITTVVGTYILVVFSLPMANWLYARLEPILGKNRKAIIVEHDAAMREAMGEMHQQARLPWGGMLAAVVGTAAIALVGNQFTGGKSLVLALPGMLVLVACALAGLVMSRLAPRLRIPAIIWVSIMGVLVSVPVSPLAPLVNPMVEKVNLLTVVTPVLAYAGLSLAKDLPVLRALGWRIVVTSLIATAGAFLAGAVIAQYFGG
ncbi:MULTISPECIES: DUF3100 domain-containing protein [unclassified Acidovorax]|uniref:DUF3100 domain-containing protein n=1 Tax=unclassified Acidovorax TaxID=2684926 RepID=UPI0009E73C54|nr:MULTISPECIES: DUF3100 domain-containing protein [unclassified Acidovorax]